MVVWSIITVFIYFANNVYFKQKIPNNVRPYKLMKYSYNDNRVIVLFQIDLDFSVCDIKSYLCIIRRRI